VNVRPIGGFADVTMRGHVFGDDPEAKVREIVRVTERSETIRMCWRIA
jgi:hypothetical protein